MVKGKLKAPLSYQGGKQRVAKDLVKLIKGNIDNTNYIDLCCGSGAVSIELINQGVNPADITMVDASDWGMFWWQISTNSFDLCYFEDIIANVPDNKDLIKSYLESYSKETFEEGYDCIPVWLLLQAGSFGGKHIWTKDGKFNNASFRSYWKPTETSSRRSPVNPMMPMPNTLLKQVTNIVSSMKSVNAYCGLVEDFNWNYYNSKVKTKDNVVVFIDPPYAGTTGYGFNMDYIKWYEGMKLPPNYQLWITDYQKHGEEYYMLNSTNKGGISGSSKTLREEILSRVF